MVGMDRVRQASVGDAGVLASLLHDFNTEFDTPSPGPTVLEGRLRSLLEGAATVAVVAGEPPAGFALLTLRPNVWYAGSVALLDELYVVPELRGGGIGSAIMAKVFDLAGEQGWSLIEINVDEADVDAQRFYERHGFTMIEPTTGERAFYLHREMP